MNLKKYIMTLAMLLIATGNLMAQNKKTTVYMFGFSASFNDSTVYMTEIQQVDDAWVNNKTNHLVKRDDYSYQLRNYLKAQGEETPTCVTFYALKPKDIQKKYDNLKKRYTDKRKGDYIVRELPMANFSYTAVLPDDQ